MNRREAEPTDESAADAAQGDGGCAIPGEADAVCAALSHEAAELAALLRTLQEDFSTIGPGALPDQVVVSAQSLDRVCQTLDDFGTIFARLAASGDGGAFSAGVLAAAVAEARQDHLRRRLLTGDTARAAEIGTIELF